VKFGFITFSEVVLVVGLYSICFGIGATVCGFQLVVVIHSFPKIKFGFITFSEVVLVVGLYSICFGIEAILFGLQLVIKVHSFHKTKLGLIFSATTLFHFLLNLNLSTACQPALNTDAIRNA
jgi:hypothetical protein